MTPEEQAVEKSWYRVGYRRIAKRTDGTGACGQLAAAELSPADGARRELDP